MSHPYSDAPSYRRWSRAVANVEPQDVDPVVTFPIRLARDEPIATGGSCFAQHIGRHLISNGFNYLVTEPGHPILTDEVRRAFNYGVFTARYGNLYTSRQLLQLFRRAYGTFESSADVWRGDHGGFVDPFRPSIQPAGFATERELERDREQHLAAVRRAFEELSTFVFTLGLTECWVDAEDGTVYPSAPGVFGGEFDSARHRFVNLDVEEVVGEMHAFVRELRGVNPGARLVLTVSPVPLAATAADRHVLVSTTYSKAVLRVAAERLISELDGVYYFPAYEIVTGNFSRGSYFAEDLRSIREEGVKHVMSLFFRHASAGGDVHEAVEPAPKPDDAYRKQMSGIVGVLCDEDVLDP